MNLSRIKEAASELRVELAQTIPSDDQNKKFGSGSICPRGHLDGKRELCQPALAFRGTIIEWGNYGPAIRTQTLSILSLLGFLDGWACGHLIGDC